MSPRTVLISGAGIAGTTVAYWLLKWGSAPVLIERAPHFREGGYMIDFWGTGFDVAERMGLISALRAAGYRIDRLEFVGRDGRLKSWIEATPFGGRRATGSSVSRAAISPARSIGRSARMWNGFSATASQR